MSKPSLKAGINKKILFLASIILFAGVGITILSLTKAATPTASLQPEDGSLNRSSLKVSDTAYSGGAAVKFSPAQQNSTMNIFFGTTHMHTACCNNHGEAPGTATAREIYDKAKNNGGYKFMVLTEHSGSSGPSSQGLDPAVFYEDVKKQAVAFTDSNFIGLAGSEYSDNDTDKGHMTAVNTDAFPNPDGSANSATLMDYLVSQKNSGKPAYGGFNHPGAGGHPGSVVSRLTAARREVVVMSEVHNSTLSNNDLNHLAGLIVELDRGWRVAPTCGADGHGLWRPSTSWGEPGLCRTGMLATSLTRDNLNDAFMNRRIYSTRDRNMQIQYKANGQWMGSIIGKPTTVNFDIQISDPDTTNAADKITKVEIITEAGAIAATQTFDSHAISWKPSIAGTKKYYFLKVYNGERTTYTAAAAPVWLE